MKHIYISLFVIGAVLLVGFFYFFSRETDNTEGFTVDDILESASGEPEDGRAVAEGLDIADALNNGVYYLPGLEGGAYEEYQLTTGSFVRQGDLGASDRIEVGIVDLMQAQSGDDSRYFVWLGEGTGGTGIFYYVAHAEYDSEQGIFVGTGAVFVGDRIIPQGVELQGEEVTISFLTREPDEPFSAEPTVPSERVVDYAEFFEYQQGSEV